ncbi:MAG: lipase [Salinibacterium sp.]|nr:lipase [Salinibacterium sp.]
MNGLLDIPLDGLAGLMRGVTELESVPGGIVPLRLPAWTRTQQADEWIELWGAHTLGVRLVTLTSASHIRITATVTRMAPAPGEEPLFVAGFLAAVDGVGVDHAVVSDGPRIVTLADRSRHDDPGPATTVTLTIGKADAPRQVEVWFPHSASVVIHRVESDAELLPAPPSERPRWVHHGSSISHSLEALTPRETWPQLAATELDLELTNLAIAGNAQLDPFVARTIAAIPADIVTLKLGVNVVNRDSMRDRAFVPALHGFLDLVREGNPGVPILVLTSIASPALESTPGPSTKGADGMFTGSPRVIHPGDGTLTLARTRELVTNAVLKRRVADPDLYLADGLELFGLGDSDLLRDGLHPSAEGYGLIAARFAARARDSTHAIGEAFARVL